MIREDLLRAWAYCTESRIAEAVAEIAKCALVERPEDPSERALLAAVLLLCGERGRGLFVLRDQDWEQTDPSSAGKAGAALLRLGLVRESVSPLKRAALGKDISSAGIHLINLGRALTILGHTDEALPYLQEGVSLFSGENSLALRSIAEALLALGRPDEALAYLPSDSEDIAILCSRVIVLAFALRFDEAADFLRNSIDRLPAYEALVLMAADLAELRGRTGEAIALLRRAINKDSENIRLWARLAVTGRWGETLSLAHEAANKALELAEDADPPLRALALCADAHVKCNGGDIAGAEKTFRDVLQLIPCFVPALSGLGNLLVQKGQLEEAISCFQQVRAAAPLQGWSQLIRVREVPEDHKILEDMERLAHQPGLEGPVRSGLLFTLAEAWDRKKDYDRAMKTAQEANEASKRHLVYKPKMHRAAVDREIARFSRDFMHSRLGGHPSRLPVFVLGMPRSGTTLTEQILAGHSKVHGAGELSQIGELIRRMVLWERHLGSDAKYPDCISNLSESDIIAHAEILLKNLQAMAPVGSDHVIDKLPHNFEHIGLIKLIFPNATIFHCRRDPRDIAISNYITDYAAKFGGMGFAYDLAGC